MDIVTIDFETYWDKDYSLSKLTTEEYVRSPLFEVIGVAVKFNDQPTDWYSGDDVGGFLRAVDYSDKAILCHNTAFDGAILAWHYGIRPKLWLDTMSMARPLHNITVGGSLKALATYYGVGEKGDEVMRTQGLRRKDFTSEQMERFGQYATLDADLTWAIFCKMAPTFPKQELLVIDQTLRMFIEPKFELHRKTLLTHLQGIQARRQALFARLGGEDKAKKFLMSNLKLAGLLIALGVEPPMKISRTTGKETYAFAKTDQAFLALLDHPKAAVRAVVEARLGTKSTIEETRTRRFLQIAGRGRLPIMLRYYGAHTGRFSGADRVNLQNLPRGGALRKAVVAPYGHVVVACDSSQIEARMVAYVAGQDDLVQAFRDKKDVYCEFASEIYGRTITKADELERFLGKTSILGLGYGMGAPKFMDTLATGPKKLVIDEAEAGRVVNVYRKKYHRIASLWQQCTHVLRAIAEGSPGQINDLLCWDAGGLILPTGFRVPYPALRYGADGYEYINDARAYRTLLRDRMSGGDAEVKWTKIYGGKCVENWVQALARVVVSEQMVKIGKRYPVALQVHDEVICVVPEAQAEECKAYMVRVMSTPPKWAPDLPVACEVGVGPSYGEAK